MNAAKETIKPKRGMVHRMPAADFQSAEEVFKAALALIVPDDQTQRKAFEKLMPYLFVLRNKGCSWDQLTKLLNDCGFRLQSSTVRNYFSEMAQTKMDICQRTMNEQILLMAEVKKQTQGVDVSLIAGKVSAIMDKQTTAAQAKIDAMFGVPATPLLVGQRTEPASPANAKTREPASPAHVKSSEPASPAHVKSSEPASPAREKNGAGLRPAPEPQAEQESTFGHLVTDFATSSATGKPTFFDLEDQPAVPVLTPAEPANGAAEVAATPQDPSEQDTSSWKCRPLAQGVTAPKKRQNLPPEVYEERSLEHPAIPGVMLTLAERLYGTALEFIDGAGEIHVETIIQKRFRLLWQKPVPQTATMTGKNFTEMDTTLFHQN